MTLSFKTPAGGRRLLAIDSGNPRLEYRLGRIYEDMDPAEGISHLRRATQLSPNSQRYWSHLASTCESNEDTKCADSAWEFLVKLCPSVPLYRWHAGESYLRTNQLNASLVQFRRLLDVDPEYAPQVWYALLDVQTPDAIFQELLVKRGDPIKRGQVIAKSGQTGNVDAPQLHFEVRKGPTPQDPMPMLNGG